MKSNHLFFAAFTVMIALVVRADVLELKDGRVLTGKFVDTTDGTIRLQTTNGVQFIPTNEVLTLTAAEYSATAAAPVPTAITQPFAATSTGAVTLNAGTILRVSMAEGTTSRDSIGKPFVCLLQTDLVVDGVLIAKSGTRLYGRVTRTIQAGPFAGSRSLLELRLREVTVGGSLVQIGTSAYVKEGALFAGTTTRASGIGISAQGEGQVAAVMSSELLEFRLELPVTINLVH